VRQHFKESDASKEVNMTPVIDVSLVLVVILLLATPLAFESSIAVRRSPKASSAAPDPRTMERIELDLVSETTVQVNRTKVDRAAVEATLRPLIEASAHGIVTVSCRDNVSHGAFVDVLDQAKLSGANEIAVLGR
jgi:biopolymer transport protein ExbD